jgi:hypothetical protein
MCEHCTAVAGEPEIVPLSEALNADTGRPFGLADRVPCEWQGDVDLPPCSAHATVLQYRREVESHLCERHTRDVAALLEPTEVLRETRSEDSPFRPIRQFGPPPIRCEPFGSRQCSAPARYAHVVVTMTTYCEKHRNA